MSSLIRRPVQSDPVPGRDGAGSASARLAARLPGPWKFTAAMVGVVVFSTILYYRIQTGLDVGSDLRMIYDRAGDALRDGGEVYWRDPIWNNFYYAPPLAVLFATVSWIPLPILHALLIVADLLALRAITGAWWSAFALCAWPFVPLEFGGGNINLLIAATIVVAVRGGPGWPLVLSGMAKLSPLAAADPRHWRGIGLAAVLLCLLTIPWLSLWADWLQLLVDVYGRAIGPMVPVPFPVRAVVALGFLALWRPWTRAAAAVIAIPAFYWGTLIYAPIPFIVWWRGRSEGPSAPSG